MDANDIATHPCLGLPSAPAYDYVGAAAVRAERIRRHMAAAAEMRAQAAKHAAKPGAQATNAEALHLAAAPAPPADATKDELLTLIEQAYRNGGWQRGSSRRRMAYIAPLVVAAVAAGAKVRNIAIAAHVQFRLVANWLAEHNVNYSHSAGRPKKQK